MVMPRVTATKTRNSVIVRLRAVWLGASAARSRSAAWTVVMGHLPDLGTDPVGDRVDLPVRVPGVEPGDHERRDELEQAEDQRDIDVAAEQLRAHEVPGVGAENDVERVPQEERDGHREDEAAQRAPQPGE